MHDFQEQCQTLLIAFLLLDSAFVISRIHPNEGLGKCYQPWPSARLITLTSTLIIPDITKASSNNKLLLIYSFAMAGYVSQPYTSFWRNWNEASPENGLETWTSYW